MKTLLLSLLLLLMSYGVFAQQNPFAAEDLKIYYLVLLKKGQERSQDSATAAHIQEGHLQHLHAMVESGKMDIVGPVMDEAEFVGICVYNTETLEEAKNLASEDPAVKAGRLVVEVHPWYSIKGSCLK